ncbi:MAG TPA: GDP-mannose 4,6-dehydratase, partial [Nitriliruptorales bacterium]
DVVAIEDVVPHRTDPASGTSYTSEGGDLEVWDGESFVACTARSANWRSSSLVTLHGRGGVVETTPDHVVFLDGGDRERAAGDVAAGESAWIGRDPTPTAATVLTADEAWLLGILVADGWVSPEGSGRVVNGDESVLAEVAACWERVAAGTWRKSDGALSEFSDSRTPSLELQGNRAYLRMLRGQLYTREKLKRVPKRVLNAAPDLQEAFLRGYNTGDGSQAGNGTDEFNSFRTTSPVLAAGLVWLARTALGRRVTVYLQDGVLGGGSSYQINLGSGANHGDDQGAHLRRPIDEIRKVTRRRFTGWTFDLATTSGRFAAGVGGLVVHNSPRRGPTFVTRKITRAVASIVAERQSTLYLGNLNAKRDWGHARDYVRGMWMMLQQPEPDDYVLAMGETHTVREFAARAFAHVGLDWAGFTQIDPHYYRPTEVEHLHGDASATTAKLGWKPEVSFRELITGMVEHDLSTFGLSLDAARARVAETCDADVRIDPDAEPDFGPSHGPQPPDGDHRQATGRTVVEGGAGGERAIQGGSW